MANKPTQNKKTQPMTVQHIETTIHHGPLPDPTTLNKYDNVVPGAAELIVRMFEEQARHRMDIEKKQIEDMQNRTAIEKTYASSESFIAILGVLFAFIISLITLLGGLYMIVFAGHEYIGTIFSGVGLTPLIGIFINGTKTSHNSSKRKD